MKNQLTTHVLDTARGIPAAGLRIDLVRLKGEDRERLVTIDTNAGGRSDVPLLEGSALLPGRYELVFHVGDYFLKTGLVPNGPSFLEEVPIRFGIHDPEEGWHIPLLVSPWSYSTYRGS